ncbi:hypothetical protein N9O69_04270, partial [Alphaproteobacteria bacterium]|nr:hypothetical protein [Alphaproteobacteria bacterium]
KLFLKIMLIPFIFLITNCANNKTVENSKPVIIKEEKKTVIEKKSCKEKSRVRTADETFIQFRHDVSEVDNYKKVAFEWCEKFSKIAISGKLKCGSCCDASYFCK